MTTIESKEIRGITLKVLYLLMAFSVTATAGIMTSWFSLKQGNEDLNTKIEVLKSQVSNLEKRLDNIEKRPRSTSFTSQVPAVRSTTITNITSVRLPTRLQKS
jgi:cell division protein FtsB